MNKLIAVSFALALSLSSFAQDLTLPGAKWQAKFTGYVCQAFGQPVARAGAFESLDVKFEKIVTDSTLDNGLITGSFTEEENACRYSAILFADNAGSTIRLVQSKAHANGTEAACANGKAAIDAAFEGTNPYLYWGHPHNLSIMSPIAGNGLCNGGAVGINFVNVGKIPQ